MIDTPGQLRALLADLDSIEKLARRDHDEPRYTSESAFRELLGMLNFAAPHSILKQEADWYEALEKGVAEDRAILTSLVEGSAVQPMPALPEPPGGFSEDTADFSRLLRPVVSDVSGKRPYWGQSLLTSSNGLWLGHLQDKITDRLEEAVPRDCKVQWLIAEEVTGPAPHDETTARALAWKVLLGINQYLWVQISGPAIGAVRIRTCFRLTRQRMLRRRAAERKLWHALAEPPVPTSASVLEALASLAMKAQQIRREAGAAGSRLEDLRNDIRTCPDLTDLMRRLGTSIAALHHLTQEDRACLIKKLPEVIDSTGWSRLVDHLPPVVRALGPCASAGDAIFDSLCRRSPKALDINGLDAVASTAEALQLHNIPRLTFVLGVLESAFRLSLSPEARTELRALLFDKSGNTAPATIAAMRETARQRRDHGDLRGVFTALSPLVSIKALLVQEWEDLGQQFRAWLAEDCPSPELTAWDAADQYADYFQTLNQYLDLDELIRVPPGGKRELHRLVGPFLEDHPTVPVRLPGSFWPVLRKWLLSGNLEPQLLKQYRLDVAVWHLVHYREHPTQGAMVRECGLWLRKPEIDCTILARLADRFISKLEDLPQAADITEEQKLELEGLRSLCAPDSENVSFQTKLTIGHRFDAIWASLGLRLWQARRIKSDRARQLASEWHSWVEMVACDAGEKEWKEAWQKLILRGLLFDDSDERSRAWAEELKRFSSREFVVSSLDNILHEFEVQVLDQLMGELDRARQRLDILHDWLRAGAQIDATRQIWFGVDCKGERARCHRTRSCFFTPVRGLTSV